MPGSHQSRQAAELGETPRRRQKNPSRGAKAGVPGAAALSPKTGDSRFPSRWSSRRSLRYCHWPGYPYSFRSLRRHRPLIVDSFLALGGISAGTVEGFNGTAKLTTRKAYGFRTPQGIEFALFHVIGNLPEPEFTHKFC